MGGQGGQLADLTGEVIDGILDVGQILGKGGMGIVYQVFHREWNRQLAMKIPLYLGAGSNFDLKRWIREAHTWIDLGLHPRVVSCWFVRQWNDVPVLFLDLYSGGSLKEKLDARSHPPETSEEWAQALVWLIHTCEGLSHAHQMGLIHRDIKPANLLFDSEGCLAVTDFGLGKAFDKSEVDTSAGEPNLDQVRKTFAGQTNQSLTRTGVMTGTPHYAPPEQWMQRPVGPMADVYAFGVVAYQCLLGRHPFEPPGERWDLGRLVSAHLMEEVPAAVSMNPDVPKRLSEMMSACLAKKPEDRPQRLDELRDVLLGAYRERTGSDYAFGMPQPLSQRADSLNNKAVSLWSIGLRKEATQAWAEADRLERNHLEVTFNRQVTSWLTGRRSPAEVEATIRELATSSSRGGSVLGQFLLARGEFGEAAEYLADCLQNPGLKEDGTLWRSLGRAANASGNLDLAREAYTRTLELIPSDGQAQKALTELSSGAPPSHEGLVAKAFFREYGQLLAWTTLESGRGLALVYRAQLVIIDLNGKELARAPVDPMTSVVGVESRGYHLLLLGAHDAQVLTFALIEGALNLESSSHWNRQVLGFLDAERILTGSTTLQIRARADESEQGALMVGHEKQVLCHLMLDSDRLVTGGSDRVLRCWSLRDAQCVQEGRGHQDFVQKLILARQGQLLASGDDSGLVLFWLMPKLERLQKLQFQGAITEFSVYGSGQQEVLLVGYKDEAEPYRTAVVLLDRMQVVFDEPGRLVPWSPGFALWNSSGFRVFSLPDGVEWRNIQLPAAGEMARCLSSPTGDELLFWTREQEYIRWRLPSAVPDPPSLPLVRANTLSEVHQARVQYASLMEKAWTSFRDEDWNTAYWELSRARLVEGYSREPETLDFLSRLTHRLARRELREMWRVRELVAPGQDKPRRLTIDQDGRWAATSSGSLIRLWDLRQGVCVRGMTGHREEVVGLSFWESEERSGSAPLLFSFSADRTVRLWDTNNGECIQTLVASEGAIVTVGLCRETRFFAFVDRSGRLRTGRWSQKQPFTLESLAEYSSIELPNSVTVGREGRWVIVAEDHSKVFHLSEPESEPRLVCELDYRLTVLPAGGRHLIGSTEDGGLELFDLEDGLVVANFAREGAAITSMAITDDGGVLATVDANHHLQLWLVESGQCVMERPLPDAIRTLAFSGNGRYLASLNQNGVLVIWEMEWQLDPETEVMETIEKRLPRKGVWSRLWRRFGA